MLSGRKQIATSSKIVCKNMSRKPEDNEPVSEGNKQFDPVGKEGSHCVEKRMY